MNKLHTVVIFVIFWNDTYQSGFLQTFHIFPSEIDCFQGIGLGADPLAAALIVHQYILDDIHVIWRNGSVGDGLHVKVFCQGVDG